VEELDQVAVGVEAAMAITYAIGAAVGTVT